MFLARMQMREAAAQANCRQLIRWIGGHCRLKSRADLGL
jgi:hypothetical protein